MLSGFLVLVCTLPLPAAELHCDVGLQGAIQVGRWTPIRVTTDAEDVRGGVVAVTDSDGRPVEFALSRQSDDAWAGLFQSGRLDSAIHVNLTRRNGSNLEQVITPGRDSGVTSYRQQTRFWMTVGRRIGFEAAADALNDAQQDPGGPRSVHVIPARAAAFPTTADALDSVELVVIGADPLTLEQSHALETWILRGGRLVVVVGSAAERFRQTPVASWMPIGVGDVYEERQTAALTGRVTAKAPNKGVLRSLDELRLSRLEARDGVVLIEGPTAPVVVRAAYGLGTVTAVALDLDSAPFVMKSEALGEEPVLWGGLAQLCVQLAGRRTPSAASDGGRDLQLAPTGVSDLQSQLAAILDHFPEVRRASNWNVIGLLTLYLLIVGPLDYFVVHRLLRRPQLTWATLPAWVVLASWWATALADANNGPTVSGRQIEVLDVAADVGQVRVSAWRSLYSPETQRVTVAWRPELGDLDGAEAAAVRVAAVTRPEEGFRGMYRRGGIRLGGAGYTIESGARTASAVRVPVDQWSSLGLAGEAFLKTDAADPLAICRQVFDDRGQLVRFELTHRLPGVLVDWFAVEKLQVTFPVDPDDDQNRILPNAPYDLARRTGQKLLKAYIQGELTKTIQRKTGSDTYIRADEYDPLGLDPEKLFRTLTFHEAVGGSGFTHLNNETLVRHDLSGFIHLNRLVVFGRLTAPAAAFEVEGDAANEVERTTFVRMIVPIVREFATPSL